MLSSVSNMERDSRPRARPVPGCRRIGTQHPRQIFFNRAFINVSSSLILSTYFPLAAFEIGAARSCFAATGDAGGGAALS